MTYAELGSAVTALPAHRRVEIDHFVEHSGAVAYLVADRMRDFDYRPMAAAILAESAAPEAIFPLIERERVTIWGR